MKHAFLIISHNEFKVLQLLINCLDSKQTDIYVHFDKKVKVLPQLTAKYSDLVVLNERVDVRWGDVSQIECELTLFEVAMRKGPYQHYHLLSGTHLPLKRIDDLMEFFSFHEGKEIMDIWSSNLWKNEPKLSRYNFFTRYYLNKSYISTLSQFLWKLFVKIQKILYIYNNPNEQYVKSSNWLTLTENAITYLVHNKIYILNKYRYTLCGDEFFVATELSKQNFCIISSDKLLYQVMGNANPRVLTCSDYENILTSNCLYARKFSESRYDVIEWIMNNNLKIII